MTGQAGTWLRIFAWPSLTVVIFLSDRSVYIFCGSPLCAANFAQSQSAAEKEHSPLVSRHSCRHGKWRKASLEDWIRIEHDKTWQEYHRISPISLIIVNKFPIVSSILSFAPRPSGKSQQVKVEMAGHWQDCWGGWVAACWLFFNHWELNLNVKILKHHESWSILI